MMASDAFYPFLFPTRRFNPTCLKVDLDCVLDIAIYKRLVHDSGKVLPVACDFVKVDHDFVSLGHGDNPMSVEALD
jgi:hypothetical protein